ncbi:MAG: class I SAM-dependent methyltransferase [Planctomycetes bacterium]|nr:class I SAM-dependent methyltransferase [Planctomycetota bacterium]
MNEMKAQTALWNYYQNRNRESFDQNYARLGYILKQIPHKSRVLNIGIGNAWLENNIPCIQGTAFSLDPDAESVQQRNSDAPESAKVGVCSEIPWEEDFFDVVVVSEVLEHIPEGELSQSLNEIQRVLKPGGIILGTVPAEENLEDNKVLCPHCNEVFHKWGHEKSFSEVTLQAALAEPFRSLSIKRRCFPAWRLLNTSGKILACVKMFKMLFGLYGSGEQFFFRAHA